jgi:nitrite reductase/ring-hydroxylating ferredoxin subunit
VGLSLDWEDNDFFSADFTHLVCKNHGAQFLPGDGTCVAGPCAGIGLKSIQVVVEKNTLYTLMEVL